MRIRKFSKLFALSLLSFSTSAAVAAVDLSVLDCIRPYAGVDAGQRLMAFKEGYGKGLFDKYVPQWSPYVGLEFNECFAIEGGFESTEKKTKAIDVGIGGNALGYQITPGTALGSPEGHLFSELLQGWRMDLIGFAPCIDTFPSLRFFGSIGLSRKKIRLVDSQISDNGIPETPEDVARLRRTLSNKKSLLRLSVGAQQLITDNIGVRGIIGWENTRRFNGLKTKEVPEGAITASLNNNFIFSLGFFVRF